MTSTKPLTQTSPEAQTQRSGTGSLRGTRFALIATVPFLAAGLIAAPAVARPGAEAPAPAARSIAPIADDLPTEPPEGHDTSKLQWYDASPTLRGTSGAAIEGQTEAVVTYDDDGVTGMIKNFSGQDVMVSSRLSATKRTANAILKPGDEMPYKLYAAGQLEFTKMQDGKPIAGATTKLWLKDPFMGRPSSTFTPAGHSSPVNTRTGWKEGDSHHEIWGSTQLWVKRENDGWRIPSSDKYRTLYGDPNTPGTTDWAIFTIHIDSL